MASPITSVAPPSSSPITSVSQHAPSYSHPPAQGGALLARLHLDVRGERFVVERERLMALPESILLCLFPNGLILSRPPGGAGAADAGEDVYGVDFDPACFHFVLEFFKTALEAFYGTATSPGLYHSQQALLSTLPSFSSPSLDHDSPSGDLSANPLLHKQGIIVLREELEYFVIPAKGEQGEELMEMKRRAGEGLLDRRRIFEALQRNVNKENNVAEQHLIDMLCMSGFNREDLWGHRDVEPARCSISSIALVLLKTGISHPSSLGEAATIDHAQMATAQKLLLFWRKPARKCWWDGVEVEGKGGLPIKVWARRVWTLELNL